MAKIQLLAFETSGLNPVKNQILEVGVACYDTKTDEVEAANYLLDPGSEDFGDEIMKYHNESGLFPEMIEAGSAGQLKLWENVWLPPGHMAICYAKDFIVPFLLEAKQKNAHGTLHGSAASAMSFEALKTLGTCLHGLEISKMPSGKRVADKLALMVQVLRLMREGVE